MVMAVATWWQQLGGSGAAGVAAEARLQLLQLGRGRQLGSGGGSLAAVQPRRQQPGGSTAVAVPVAVQRRQRQFCSSGQLGGGGGSLEVAAAWCQCGCGGGSLAAARPRPQRQLGHWGKLGSRGGQLGSRGGGAAAAQPWGRQRQHGSCGGTSEAAGSLSVAAAAWRQGGCGTGSLVAAWPWQRQRSSGSSSFAATAKSKPRFCEKSPRKMGVTWNLLIAVTYDNIGIFLHTGFFVS